MLINYTSRSFPHSRLITRFVTRLTRRVPLVEQDLPTLPAHLSSPPVYNGVRVTRSLVLYVCFVDHCLSFCTFSFGHCVVCSSSIYGFWLSLYYLQTLLIDEDLTATVKCRTTITMLFLVINLCLRVMFDSLWCSFTITSIYFLLQDNSEAKSFTN
jgi:hypothetical protein